MENDELEKLLPQINLSVPPPALQEEKENLISDEFYMGLLAESLNDARQDKEEVNELLGNLVNMVFNEGDATTSSKEALVNLVKIKNDIANTKVKLIDLVTRVKLKEKDTFPKYMNVHAQQTNNIGSDKRELIKTINKIQKKKSEGK